MPDQFETDNLYLGAFLLLRKIDKIGYTVDERGHITFQFADHDQCEQLRAEYELAEVTISLPDYLMYLDRLRDIITQVLGRPSKRQKRV